MKSIILVGLILQQVGKGDGCPSFRPTTRMLSYLPAAIQILQHYEDQLVRYYRYNHRSFCFPNPKNSSNNSGLMNDMKKPAEDKVGPNTSKEADFCVYPTFFKFYGLSWYLQREAKLHNLNESQGFPHQTLMELEKSSKMTSAGQLYFILNKLLSIGRFAVASRIVRCQIIQLIQDLRRPTSRLYRHLLMVKPLNYAT